MRYKVTEKYEYDISRDEILDYFQMDIEEWVCMSEKDQNEHIGAYVVDNNDIDPDHRLASIVSI